MDQQRSNHKAIWSAGSSEGATTLLNRILEEVNRRCGNEAVNIDSTNSIFITWLNDMKFEISRDHNGFWIRPPSGPDIDPLAWNESLETFYRDVIEPLKDRTGGVAAGIGFQPQDEID